MTTQAEPGEDNRLARTYLPWLVGIVALAVYLLTLNRWISFNSLPYVARMTGKMWMPELTGPYGAAGPFTPLLFLVTYPVRWLPVVWVPLALNIFSAVCAALTLGLLARSVALLPHDRTHEQRQREHSSNSLLTISLAWIPPVIAVMLCGLQITFWENATAASGDIFELLLFAYVVRCLLEYRIDRRDSWLLRASLIYGAAMTGSWLMIGVLPMFIAALVWIRGFSFFKLRFLVGMAVCGGIGLSLYLLLPLIHVLEDPISVGVWQALKVNLVAQRDMLQIFYQRIPVHLLLLLAITSFLPILLVGIRWSSYFGDPSKVGIAVTTAILHISHGALLIACVWLSFDPAFSPRYKLMVIPALYYLGALSAGYFAGYFLLVFIPLADRMGRIAPWQVNIYRVSRLALWALLLAIPAGLIWKNLPQVRMTNGPAVSKYAVQLTEKLPSQAVLLSDSDSPRGSTPRKLWLAESWLERSGLASSYICLDTMALQMPAYQGMQQKRHPGVWPLPVDPKSPRRLPDAMLLNLVLKLSEKYPVFYLQPSFGYYFEPFYPQLHGLALEMRRYPTNSVSRPPMEAEEIEENENFWKENQAMFASLAQFIDPTVSDQQKGLGGWLRKTLHIPFERNATAVTLGRFYSHTLVLWGVQLQRAGRFNEAAAHFDTALALNPENFVAEKNLECNRLLQARKPLAVRLIQSEEEFGKFRNLQEILRENGPFDEPSYLFAEAIAFVQGRLFRQGTIGLERVHQMAPEYLPVSVLLARFYASQNPDKALELLSQIRAHPEAWEEFGIRRRDVVVTEAAALFASRKTAEAEQILQAAMDQNPRDQYLMAMAVQLSVTFGRLTNALKGVERELQISPTNTSALVAKGYLQLQMGNYSAAIEPLSRVLATETNNYIARFDRAIAYLRNDQLDEAQQDYLILQRMEPTSFANYYGLGEIAWRRKDTNMAIHYYELYLTNAIPDSEEAKSVAERLLSLTAKAAP